MRRSSSSGAGGKKSEKKAQKKVEVIPPIVESADSPGSDSGISKDEDDKNVEITFRTTEKPDEYLTLMNNNGMFVTFTEKELDVCLSVMKLENFNYTPISEGVESGAFLQSKGAAQLKFGMIKLSPKTVKPYEFTDKDMEISMIVIKGKFTIRSTAYYELNGTKYLYGEELKFGDTLVIPPNCAYTLENWSGEECCIGFTSMIRPIVKK